MNLVRACCCVMACAFAAPVTAKQLYRYQDESGAWVYTDKAPETAQPVEVRRMEPERETSRVQVRSLRLGDRGGSITASNNYYAPVEIELRAEEAMNTTTTPSLPVRFVIPANSTRTLIDYRQTDPRKAWRFRYNYAFTLGDPKTTGASAEPYLPPIGPGAEYRISQAFDGSFSHNTPESRYAVDISMPEGSPVHAARSGIVTDVARDFYAGGTEREKYGARANYVRVLHEDGTFAVYAHLQWESVLVHVGQRVAAGQFLGRSGNTGFSSGPHLHFVVQRNQGMATVSVPFEFAGEAGPTPPLQGMVLRGR